MDRALLEYEMKKHGITIGEMCKILDISKSAFYRKVNEKSQFTQREIKAIVDTLQLDSPVAIFFAN